MLTFVLPLSTGRDIELAFGILLPSLKHFYNSDELFNLIIIISKKDTEILNYYKVKDMDIIILYEEDIISTENIYNSYYLQMLLKLLVAKYVKTDYYITLDADLYFCKDCGYNNFIGEKPFYYKVNKKNKWLRRVEHELNITMDYQTNQTPFVFITNVVNEMNEKLNTTDLIMKKGCSEYTLYLGYIYDKIDQLYIQKNFMAKPLNYGNNKNNRIDNEVMISEGFMVNDNHVIGCIQSRVNQHKNLLETLKLYIPNITFNPYNIAIMTVVSDDEYYRTYQDAIYTKKNYCKYHNYTFEFEIVNKKKYPRNKGWLKIYKLLEIIKNYDFVFMSDADVCITNRDIRLTDIINKYDLHNKMCLITKDYNTINSGNVIWRNCPETIEFLNLCLSTSIEKINEPFKIVGVYEQPSIIYLLNTNKRFRDNVCIIPQNVINSYPKFHPKTTIKWTNGDFLIHFAGFNYMDRWNKFNIINEVKKYNIIYKLNIIKKEGSDYGKIF